MVTGTNYLAWVRLALGQGVQVHRVRKMWRYKGDLHAKVLDTLRVKIPRTKMVRMLCRGRMARSGLGDTTKELQELFQKHPSTTILTCTKQTKSLINDLSVQAVFGNPKRLATIWSDVGQNPANYDAEGSGGRTDALVRTCSPTTRT